MNRTYSIRIRHFRTGVWTHTASATTTASAEEVQQQFEKDYGQPVQVVEITESQLAETHKQMYLSTVYQFD